MSLDALLAAVLGPFGAIVVLVVAVIALSKAQWVVPGPMYAASEHRNSLLETEAQQTQKILKTQADELTEQRIVNARLETNTKHLTEQIQRLTTEIEGLRQQVGQL